MKIKFITFEGSEGSGKSTQSKLLHEYFIRSGIKSIWTREPGGTKFGERIREIFITSENLATETELLLNMAARAEHISKVIEPSLDSDIMVICDRFIDSTYVYQGIIGGIGEDMVMSVHNSIFKNLMPDITFFMNMPPEKCLERLGNRQNSNNRFDKKNLDFHNKVYNSFLKLAGQDSKRIISIDADRNSELIHENIIKEIKVRNQN